MLNRTNCSAPSASRRLGATALAFAGLVPAIGFAASVSFQTPTTFTDTSVLDAPLSLSGYTSVAFVQAQNFGGAAQTVATPALQSITFANAAEINAAPSGTASAVFYGGSETNANLFAGNTGSAAFNAVLDSQSWATQQAGGNRQTVRIGGLTIGQTYLVQLFFSDQRAGNGGRTQFLADATSGGNVSAEFSTASATSVIGSFSASAVTQDIFIFPGLTTTNPNDTTVAAFTLYSATAVPEPASFAAIAGVLALGVVGLRRSRRR